MNKLEQIMGLVDNYAELRHTQGSKAYNTKTAEMYESLRESIEQALVSGKYEWNDCLRIANEPEVDEALQLFAEGETTEDQAVCVVREVLIAAEQKCALELLEVFKDAPYVQAQGCLGGKVATVNKG